MAEDFRSSLDRIHRWLYELAPLWHRVFLLWLGAGIALALAFATGLLSLGAKPFWWFDAVALTAFALSHARYGRRRR